MQAYYHPNISVLHVDKSAALWPLHGHIPPPLCFAWPKLQCFHRPWQRWWLPHMLHHSWYTYFRIYNSSLVMGSSEGQDWLLTARPIEPVGLLTRIYRTEIKVYNNNRISTHNFSLICNSYSLTSYKFQEFGCHTSKVDALHILHSPWAERMHPTGTSE